MSYEYRVEPAELERLNELGAEGWRVVCPIGDGSRVLLERELPPSPLRTP
jgi:hypothetical protein